MHEFETFVYIDVQKTGSTFISELLEKFCTEAEVRYRKHGRAQRKYDPDKFYFISVRDPLDQYVSLYSHGCGGNGGLFHRLNTMGHGELYDSTWEGFRRWFRFVLRPENAKLLDDKYGEDGDGEVCKLIGFQTYRFLEMALLDANETLKSLKTQDDVRKAYAEKKMATHLIRYESFRDDLEELLTTKLRGAVKDLDGALKFIREGAKVNASERVDSFVSNPKLGPKIRQTLNEREWFMHEEFGY